MVCDGRLLPLRVMVNVVFFVLLLYDAWMLKLTCAQAFCPIANARINISAAKTCLNWLIFAIFIFYYLLFSFSAAKIYKKNASDFSLKQQNFILKQKYFILRVFFYSPCITYKKKTPHCDVSTFGGNCWVRTSDLLLVRQAL